MAGGQERILRRRIRSIQIDAEDHQGDGADRRVADRARPGPHRRRPGRTRRAWPGSSLETALGDPVAAGRAARHPRGRATGSLVLAVVGRPRPVRRLQHSVFRATERLIGRPGGRPDRDAARDGGQEGPGVLPLPRRRRRAVASSGCPSGRPSPTPGRWPAAAVDPVRERRGRPGARRLHPVHRVAGSQKVEVRQLLPLVDPRDGEQKADHEHDPGEPRHRPPRGRPTGRATPSSSPTPPSSSSTSPRGPPRRRSSPRCSRRRPPS